MNIFTIVICCETERIVSWGFLFVSPVVMVTARSLTPRRAAQSFISERFRVVVGERESERARKNRNREEKSNRKGALKLRRNVREAEVIRARLIGTTH